MKVKHVLLAAVFMILLAVGAPSKKPPPPTPNADELFLVSQRVVALELRVAQLEQNQVAMWSWIQHLNQQIQIMHGQYQPAPQEQRDTDKL